MSSTDTRHAGTSGAAPPASAYAVFGALTGLTAVAVLLQGLWAGLFLRYDEDSARWVTVHGLGADVALVLALVTTAWAVWKLRSRRDLVVGSVVLLVRLVGEAVLGGLIGTGRDQLTAVHVPLAMALMGLVVWLPLRARAGRR